MRTKHLFVLIHITWYHKTSSSPPEKKIFLLTVPMQCFFCGSFLLFMFCICHAFLSVHCNLVVTCCERDNLLALLYVMWCFLVFLSLSNVVPWVRCGTLLYRFMIFAFLLTFNLNVTKLPTLYWLIKRIFVCVFVFSFCSRYHGFGTWSDFFFFINLKKII